MTRIKEVPKFGTPYGDGEDPSFITDQQVEVWMYQKGQKVRFFDRSANQVGDEHPNALSALMWAYGQGWINPTSPIWLNAGVVTQGPSGKPETHHDHVLFIP